MKFVALVSGGKDSVYTICKLLDDGHKLVGLIHITSSESYSDSYMYQTVGSEVAILLGDCFNVPIHVFRTACNAINKNLEYDSIEGDEVEDLFNAVSTVLDDVRFDAISSGALHSTYQKNRVESVCSRLGLVSLAPLWGSDQKVLLKNMIDYSIDARIIKVASSGLTKDCLNMTLEQIYDYMNNQNYKYGFNYCGEGGEYETIVFDCKHFKKRIIPESFILMEHPENKISDGVYYLEFRGLKTVPKP